jgi:hypothetical protein
MPPNHLWGTTIAVPEHCYSCKVVAGMLQACCKLVGTFFFLLPSLAQAAVPPNLGAAQRSAEPGYRV